VRIVDRGNSAKMIDLDWQPGGHDMKVTLTFAAIVLAMLVASEPGFARGGAASIMNSPGYQRRLQESRQQLAQPGLQPSSPVARHRSRHRHRH
jgi:hypothetical protein